MNWQATIAICNSYRLQTTNVDDYAYILQLTRSREASNSPRDRKDGIRMARKYLNGAGPLCTISPISMKPFVGNLGLISTHFNHPSYS